MNETKIYDASEIQDEMVRVTIKDVAVILKERGYEPVNQIVGYLLSGDPGYISSYKEARTKISRLERTKILETLVREYLK